MVHVISRTFLMGILLVATALWSSGQGLAPRPGKKVILHAAKLLDVKSGTTLSDPVVVIEGDKITTVGPANSTRIPAEAERIDLPGATLLPRLIDCHVHLTTHPTLFGPAGLHISYSRSALIGARNARTTLEAGFTTVRNVAVDGFADVALRDAINAGDVSGPRMLVSGPALSITGGHRDENYLAPQFAFSKEGVADGIDAVRKKVRENIKYGADLIKVMATGGVVTEGDNPALAQYSPEELKAIVGHTSWTRTQNRRARTRCCWHQECSAGGCLFHRARKLHR